MLVVDVTELCCGCELKPTEEPATAATAATAANGVSPPGELGTSPEAELLLDTLEEPAEAAPAAEAVAPASAEAAAAAATAGEAAFVAEAEVGTSSS